MGTDFNALVNKYKKKNRYGTGGTVTVVSSTQSKEEEEFNKLVEKYRQQDISSRITKSDLFAPTVRVDDDDDDIAPVKTEKNEDAPWYKRGHFEDGWQFGDVTKSILGIDTEKKTEKESLIKTHTSQADVVAGFWGDDPNAPGYTAPSLEELAKKRDESKSQADKLKYTQLYNNEYMAQTSKVLADTRMDSTGNSILEEMEIVARMDSGKEKRQRKRVILEKMESMGIDTSDYAMFVEDKNFTAENFVKWLGNATKLGLNNFNMSLANTAEKILGDPLEKMGWENNPISKLDDYYTALYESSKYNTDLYRQKLGAGGGMQFASDFVEGTTAALPNALLAFMTRGKSLEGTAAGLMQNAAYQGANILQKAGIKGLNMIKDSQFWLSFARSYGNDYDEALSKGVDDKTAAFGATLSSLLNAGLEIGIDGVSGIQGLPKELNKGIGNILPLVTSSLQEGGEEGAQRLVNEAISYFLYDSDEEVLNPIDYARDMAIGTLSGLALGSGQIAAHSVQETIGNAAQKRQASVLTETEQKVFDKVVADEIAKAKENGEVSKKDEAKIREDVRIKLEKGYLSTDTIEEVLGGDSFKTYQDTVKAEDDLVNQGKTLTEEYNKLNKMVNEKMTGEQQVRRDELRTLLPELRSKIEDQKKNSQREQLKTKLGEDVKSFVQGSRLAESYYETERKKQAFQADLNKYDKKQQAHIKEAIESGLLNNSNRTHDLVDFTAKVSADTGVPIRYSDTQRMKEAGLYPKRNIKLKADGTTAEFDLGVKKLDSNFKPIVKVGSTEVSNYEVDFENGKITFESAPVGDVSVTVEGTEMVDAVYTKDGIVLNVKSPKYLETLTGHELYHGIQLAKLDGNLKKALKAFAEARGEYETRLKEKQDKYKGIDGADPEGEVMADLLGKYVFEGRDFIMELATKDRNVFQKLYDGVKHLVKLATAGSKEARRLAQVEREFEKVYRELAQKNTADGGATYSIGRTKSMSWADQIQGALYNGKNIRRNDTLVVGNPSDTPVANEIDNKPLAIPLSVMTKASSGKDVSHSIKKGKLAKLDEGIKNAPITIVNPERNAVVYVTDVKQGGLPVIAAFDMNATFDGDEVHKATSIHLQVDTEAMLKSLPESATVYVRKNELDPVGATNNLRGLAAKIKFIEGTVAQDKQDVKKQFSLSDTTGRQLSKEQQEYFKDSKVRDENGNLKVMYHGTPNGDFTVFKDGTYFTDNKEYADRYQNPGASSISTGKTASNPKTFEAYLDIKKPFDLSDAEAKRIYIEDYIKGGNAMGINPYLSDAEYAKIKTIDWTEGEDLRDFLTENGYDYDGLVLDEGADGGYGDDVKSRGTSYVVFSPEQVKNIGNTKPTTDPDIRFSLSEAVEETKELMAIHNLHSSELLKQLQMGGMPYPSIAITKPEMISHDNFGEVSIILNKDAIDPKKSKYNKVYSADAYTPTFPNVDYEASEEAVSRITGTVNKWYSQLPEYYQRSVRSLRDYDNINDELNRWGGEQRYAEKYVDDDGLKQVYLAENGGAVPVEMKSTETRMTDYQMKLYQTVVDKMGADVLKSFNEKGSYDKLGLARMAWLEKHGDALKDIYAEDWASDGTMTKAEALEIANEQNRLYWRDEIRRALEFMENGGVTVTETEDIAATKAKIDERIADSDYPQWVRNLFSGIEGRSGIRNSKDIFTPSGNRRSFAQTHDPLTIDNIIKAMRKENQTGQGAFGSGSIMGASAQEFGSIAEIKRNAGKLGKMDKAEHDAITDRIQDTFWDISRRYAAGKDVIDAQATLAEAVSNNESKAGIARYLKQYDYVYKYNDSIVDEILELRDYIRSLPTPYFEAKPRRAVGFDEVAAFVIPYDSDVKLKQELLNRGYNIAEYDPKVEGDRQRVVNQFEEYKFSLTDASEQSKQSGYRATLGKDVALETDEIAPVVENAALVAENDTITAESSVEDLFPDDTAPIQEEYEHLLAEREDIKGAMDAYAAVGNYDGAEQLMAEYEAVQARIAEIEADDTDRLASLDEADAPPEMDNVPEDVADNVPLTKVLVNNLAKQVKSQLGLGNNRTAEVRELIERYSNEEFPSKAHLYTEIQERFGTVTETEVDEDLKGIKALLRTYGINVDESIKAEIPDYAQFMRSNFGKVRFSKEGLPVDVAYKEFQEALPGYFPESTYVPTDQLMRIIEVANMDTTMETEYEIDWQTLEDVTDTIMNGVAEFKQNRKETLANKHGRESFQSLMKDADQYVPPIPENVAPASFSIAEDAAPVRPAIQSVQAEPDDIAPVFETSSGQQSILPEVEAPKKLTRKDLHFNIMNQIKTYFRNKGSDFDKVLKDAKDLSTFATVDNTPQRVLEKALGYKEGQMLSEMTVNRVARNETDGIKWLNSFTDKKSGLLPKISKQYGIKPGSKASAAAQMYAEGFYVGENDAIIAYGDRELAIDFPNKKVQDNIKKLARDPRIRQIYDETLAAINKSRARNAYPEIPRLDNYYLHFRAMEDTFSRIGLPFNPNDIRAKDLPTDLNGVTADLKPGQPYFASAMHRTGKRTSFDLLGGLEKYLTSAKNQIYHIDDIQTFRALRNYVAETYGQATGLQDLDLLSDEEAEQRIKDVYDAHLSTFAKFLNEEANVLAGKTSLIDRGLEGVIGRRGITFLDTLNKQVGSNMVGFNVSSSLTNFLAPVQAFAKTNKFDFVKAMAQTVYNKMAKRVGKGDNFTEESPVMIRRKGAERFYRTPYQKVGDAGYVLMGVVDDLSTELIARTKYNEFTRKGMDSQKAHYETDKWVSRLMGDRSLGQQPQLYNSKMLGLFTKFQLEVRNQLDSQFYDTIQEAKVSTEEIENKLLRNAKKAAKITSTFAQLAVMQHLFGKAFESVAGYNPAFDIIEALIKTFGWDDEEEDEDTVLDNIEEGFLSLLGDLPYTSTLTGGRIPIASALPVTQFIKGEDQYGNEKNRWQTLGEAAPYYLLPGGYGQIKKTKAGMEMFDEDLPIAGSYTDSGGLRFPVEDTVGNRLQAGLFGQWASENARDYFDNERKPLKDKQIQELIDTEMPIRDYWAYRDGLAEHEKLEDKIDYIAGLDLPISTKNILVNNVTDRKNPIDLTDYDDFATYEEFDFASKNPEKYEFLEANNISYAAYTISDGAKEEFDAVYEWVKNYPDKVTVSKAVTDNVVTYRRYAKDLDAIRADKTSSGKSISGSAKKKKWNYIDSLDIDYGAKLILFKNEYNADDTYNYEIVEYLNGRDDISFDEMNTILKELGFNVTSDGTITW